MADDAAVCPDCGGPLVDGRCPRCRRGPEPRFVHREIVLLAVLIVVAVVGFFLTRAAARANEDNRLRDAAEWYNAGRANLAAGRTDTAVRALRRATSLNRDQRTYRLALASALAASGQDEPARQVLLGIREASPEDPEVNLQLARLETRRDDLTGAVRYYQNALYGFWGDTPGDATTRRHVRLELIQYLLAHDQRGRALSELLVLSANLPEDAALQTEAGQLFLQAGDPTRALDHFQRVLQLDAKNGAALAGAGQAAFALGDYASAQRDLRAAQPQLNGTAQAKVADLAAVADLVVTRDPLRAGLPFREREARLTLDFAHAVEHLDTCLATLGGSSPSSAALDALRTEARTLTPALAPRRLRESPDGLETGLNLVYRIEQQATDACGQPSALDRALVLIGRRHDAERQ